MDVIYRILLVHICLCECVLTSLHVLFSYFLRDSLLTLLMRKSRRENNGLGNSPKQAAASFQQILKKCIIKPKQSSAIEFSIFLLLEGLSIRLCILLLNLNLNLYSRIDAVCVVIMVLLLFSLLFIRYENIKF